MSEHATLTPTHEGGPGCYTLEIPAVPEGKWSIHFIRLLLPGRGMERIDISIMHDGKQDRYAVSAKNHRDLTVGLFRLEVEYSE